MQNTKTIYFFEDDLISKRFLDTSTNPLVIGNLYEIILEYPVKASQNYNEIILDRGIVYTGLYLGVYKEYYRFLIEKNSFLILPFEVKKEIK